MVGELEVRRNSLLLVLVAEDGGGCVTVCGGLDRERGEMEPPSPLSKITANKERSSPTTREI